MIGSALSNIDLVDLLLIILNAEDQVSPSFAGWDTFPKQLKNTLTAQLLGILTNFLRIIPIKVARMRSRHSTLTPL